jgi:hypothetical protein
LVHRSSRLAATLLCIACVPVIVIVLVRWLFAVPLSAFRPVLSDEIYYWHEALTFAHAGLRGGYYTLGEVTNASGITPFGSHGAGFVMLYGLAAQLFEWHRHSIVVLNLVVIACAAWIWASCAGVTTSRLWLSALLLATFWQMTFWASTSMQESLHHAGAIVMATLFANALAAPSRAWLIASGAATLVLLSLVRPTWIILMPLWALVITRHSSRSRMISAVAGSLIVGVIILMIFNRTVAPYAGGFSFVTVLSQPTGSPQSIFANLLFNLRRTVTFSEYDDLEILHRIQYWGFLVATLGLAITIWRRSAWRSAPVAHLAVAATSMVTMLGLMLVLYSLTNWAEHRVLSAFLLFGALLTLAAPGRAPLVLVAALIISNLATVGTFRRVFEAKRQEQFVWDRRGIAEAQDAFASRVVYRPGQSRWCNTLLTGQEPPYLIAVPAGVGISVVREADSMTHVPHSRYLLVDDAALANFRYRPRVEKLATLPYGSLYLNLDADCK